MWMFSTRKVKCDPNQLRSINPVGIMDIKQSVKIIAITFVLYFCISLLIQFAKFHYAWLILSDPVQFKACLVLAALIQFSLLLAAFIGLVGAPGLYHFKHWGRRLITTALILNIGVFLLKSVARFWPNLICHYVKESMAPYMTVKEAFVYEYILYYPSPMLTIITFLVTAWLLYFFSRRSCIRMFSQ